MTKIKPTTKEWDKMGFSLKERFEWNQKWSMISYIISLFFVTKAASFVEIGLIYSTLNYLIVGIFFIYAGIIYEKKANTRLNNLYKKTFYKRRR
jgi:hypothetical protein